ncbi:hypothetical protein MFLAVUS_007454 [Mucor flavus]|uniref:Uncharacterized protein n=1 Tax=Mucor flavus TaxID=439312 RepID=A0ABP9Z4D6_9FUNG
MNSLLPLTTLAITDCLFICSKRDAGRLCDEERMYEKLKLQKYQAVMLNGQQRLLQLEGANFKNVSFHYLVKANAEAIIEGQEDNYWLNLALILIH